MEYCDRYTDYSAAHTMSRRPGSVILSNGPPNRLAPILTPPAIHRHPQAIRYQDHQERFKQFYPSENPYHHHQPHMFERYPSSLNYSNFHSSFATSELNYPTFGRREPMSFWSHHAYHAQHAHPYFHTPHYDNTYNGRLMGGADIGSSSSAFNSYRESYDYQQRHLSSATLHYSGRTSNFPYEHHLSSAPSPAQQRDYLPYYPHNTFIQESRYSHHNQQSFHELRHLGSKSEEHIKLESQQTSERESTYGPQVHTLQHLPMCTSLSLIERGLIPSPMAGSSTTTDSGIGGTSRCGSSPISTTGQSGPGYSGEYQSIASGGEEADEEKEHRDGDHSLPTSPNTTEDSKLPMQDSQHSRESPDIKSSSGFSQSERVSNENPNISSPQSNCQNTVATTPRRCDTPFISLNCPPTNFQPTSLQETTHNTTWSPCQSESNVTSINSPNSRRKQTSSPACSPKASPKLKKNRVLECDLIPSKKSKRTTEVSQTHDLREEIQDIKPLPGFQQAFGSTEIGRFFETFLDSPASWDDPSNAFESDADFQIAQPYETIDSSNAAQFDVQISASLQSVYKSSISEKSYLSEISCNGY